MRKAFDIEDINLDELIATAYRQFCKNETIAAPAVDLADVIEF